MPVTVVVPLTISATLAIAAVTVVAGLSIPGPSLAKIEFWRTSEQGPVLDEDAGATVERDHVVGQFLVVEPADGHFDRIGSDPDPTALGLDFFGVGAVGQRCFARPVGADEGSVDFESLSPATILPLRCYRRRGKVPPIYAFTRCFCDLTETLLPRSTQIPS